MRNLKGKVTMELSEYNYLLERALMVDNVIKINNDYERELEVEFDMVLFKEEIIKKALELYPDAEIDHERFSNNWNKATARIGYREPLEEEYENVIE